MVWYNAVRCATAATGVWSNGYFQPLRVTLFALTGFAAAWSFTRRLTKEATALETFVLFYVASLLAFPGSAARYVFPLIPLFAFYLFSAIERSSTRLSRWGRAIAVASAACVVLAVYGARYTTIDFGPLKDPEESAQEEDLYRQVVEITDETDVLVARRPRDLCLHTGRSASDYQEASDAELWQPNQPIGPFNSWSLSRKPRLLRATANATRECR